MLKTFVIYLMVNADNEKSALEEAKEQFQQAIIKYDDFENLVSIREATEKEIKEIR